MSCWTLCRRRRWRLLASLLLFLLLAFYLEVLAYLINTHSWAPLPPDDGEGVRVLLVADPQIIGEKDELPFLGLFTRWDADRYLERNYMLARRHVQPHAVVFLGDLFDEGSSAVDGEYRRYIRRFWNIFQLPRKQDPSPIQYIFLPGDNDVGGEGAEPVDAVKVKWFNQTFGDFRKEVNLEKAGMRIQFLQMNMFLPEEYQDPTKGRQHLLTPQTQLFRILVSHAPVLKFKTSTRETILEKLRPQVIFSAHSHLSSYTHMEGEAVVRWTDQFLLPQENRDGGAGNDSEATISLILNLERGGSRVHEISVPTCSYRMGVPHTGFGVFHLQRNGSLLYTVLWLPPRLSHLYTYFLVYLLLKASVILWTIGSLCKCLIRKVQERARGNRTSSYRPLLQL